MCYLFKWTVAKELRHCAWTTTFLVCVLLHVIPHHSLPSYPDAKLLLSNKGIKFPKTIILKKKKSWETPKCSVELRGNVGELGDDSLWVCHMNHFTFDLIIWSIVNIKYWLVQQSFFRSRALTVALICSTADLSASCFETLTYILFVSKIIIVIDQL